MPVVIDLVEHALLQRQPPRPLPPLFLPNLLGEYLLERPLTIWLDPLLIGAVVAALAMALLGVGLWLWLILGAIIAFRLATVIWQIGQRLYVDAMLIKHGTVFSAHVLRVRACRNHNADVEGAYLDVAIPVGKRRTLVGSVWMPDVVQAVSLEREGRLQVICLTRAPGTWRLLEYKNPAFSYEPLGSEERL